MKNLIKYSMVISTSVTSLFAEEAKETGFFSSLFSYFSTSPKTQQKDPVVVVEQPVVVISETPVAPVITYNLNDVYHPVSSIFPVFSGNAGSTGRLLNEINGSCEEEIQDVINMVRFLPEVEQVAALNDLSPQFKVIQYSLEKLDLLLHKELETTQYTKRMGTVPFVIGGFDKFHQKETCNSCRHLDNFNGYKTDNYYQFLGLTHRTNRCVVLFGVGASESYMKLTPTNSKANYPTAWGSLGFSSMNSRWQYGINLLFGYSFIETNRNVATINQVAHSSHDSWNGSADVHFGYSIDVSNVNVTPYENVGYIFGQEFDYTESGAPGNNYHVKLERISQIRNALGIRIQGPTKENVNVFVDGAWVYEHYYNNNEYYAALVGNNNYQAYNQATPAQNYGRVQLGLKGKHNRLDWQLTYTGLFGRNLRDNAGSIKFGYKF